MRRSDLRVNEGDFITAHESYTSVAPRAIAGPTMVALPVEDAAIPPAFNAVLSALPSRTRSWIAARRAPCEVSGGSVPKRSRNAARSITLMSPRGVDAVILLDVAVAVRTPKGKRDGRSAFRRPRPQPRWRLPCWDAAGKSGSRNFPESAAGKQQSRWPALWHRAQTQARNRL